MECTHWSLVKASSFLKHLLAESCAFQPGTSLLKPFCRPSVTSYLYVCLDFSLFQSSPNRSSPHHLLATHPPHPLASHSHTQTLMPPDYSAPCHVSFSPLRIILPLGSQFIHQDPAPMPPPLWSLPPLLLAPLVVPCSALPQHLVHASIRRPDVFISKNTSSRTLEKGNIPCLSEKSQCLLYDTHCVMCNKFNYSGNKRVMGDLE